MSLSPWGQPAFTFGWEPWVHTVRQCSALKVKFGTDLAPGFIANPTPVPPYTAIVYAGGYRPLTMTVGNTDQNGTFDWVVNLPLGPQYLLVMKDSAGYNGGSSLLWTMTTGNGGCPLNPSPITPSTLNFTRSGSAQCAQINYVMHNGNPPYQIEIIPEMHQLKTLHFATNTFDFVMDLPTGLNVYVAITDADGNSGVDQLMTVGASSDNSCLKATSTVSVGRTPPMYPRNGVLIATPTGTSAAVTSTSTGQPEDDGGIIDKIPNKSAIIAGAVGGIVALSLFTFILICVYQRRQRRLATQAPPPPNTVQQVNLPPHTLPHGYYAAPMPQYPVVTVPPMQTTDPRVYAPAPVPYTGTNFIPMAPVNAYTQPVSLPTHPPHPQPYPIGRSLSEDGTSISDHSPSMPRQNTYPGALNMPLTDRMSSDTAQLDNRKYIASPDLPPGARPPIADPHVPRGHQWHPDALESPGGSNPNPSPGTPAPDPTAVLPPYELIEGKSGAQRPDSG